MSTFLKPRHYSDISVPEYNGKPLLKVKTDEEHIYYLNWLADHLYKSDSTNSMSSPPDIKERKFQARVLGDNAFYHFLYCVDPFECYMKDGIDYDTAYREMKEYHDSLFEDYDPDCIDPLEEWISPEIWENARREYQESKNITANYTDLGYRKELSLLLSGVESRQERCAILKDFYWSYGEEASK